MPFFDLIIRWVESSDFGPKSDDLGHRILRSDFVPSDLAQSDCISRPMFLSDRKIKIRSSKSDRILNGLRVLAKIRFSKKYLPSAKKSKLPSHQVFGVFALEVNKILQATPPKLRREMGTCATTIYVQQQQ